MNFKPNFFCPIFGVKITAKTCLTHIPFLILSAKGHFVNNSSVIKGYLLLRFYLMQIMGYCQERSQWEINLKHICKESAWL